MRRHKLSKTVKKQVRTAYKGICARCGKTIFDPQTGVPTTGFTYHHIQYFSEGGSNIPDNLLLSCAKCERAHHDLENFLVQIHHKIRSKLAKYQNNLTKKDSESYLFKKAAQDVTLVLRYYLDRIQSKGRVPTWKFCLIRVFFSLMSTK